MPKYRYLGVQTAINLPPENEGDLPKDAQLIPQAEVELPAELPYVQRLVEKGLLVAIEEPKTTNKTRKSEADS